MTVSPSFMRGSMDNPGNAKYGFTREQLEAGFLKLRELGVKRFGLHAFLASNTTDDGYYPALAGILFRTAVDLYRKTGIGVSFINLSGGVGIPYRPEQKPADIAKIGEGVRRAYEEILVPAGLGDVAIFTELGRFILGPYGCLVTTAIHGIFHFFAEFFYKEKLDCCQCKILIFVS